MDARSHEVIAPEGQDVRLADGTNVTVKPIELGQLPRFVKAIRPAFGALVALAPDASSHGADGGQGADPGALALDVNATELLDLIVDHGPALSEALCIVTELDRERVDKLNLEETFALLSAMWTVNRDFFVRRVLPLLNRQQ